MFSPMQPFIFQLEQLTKLLFFVITMGITMTSCWGTPRLDPTCAYPLFILVYVTDHVCQFSRFIHNLHYFRVFLALAILHRCCIITWCYFIICTVFYDPLSLIWQDPLQWIYWHFDVFKIRGQTEGVKAMRVWRWVMGGWCRMWDRYVCGWGRFAWS